MVHRMFTAIVFCGALLAAGLLSPAPGVAGVHVDIEVALPPLVISAPPALIVIPGTYVYFPPDVGVDIFFYHGYWYRPYRGQWYIAAHYNGPWSFTAVERVPGVLLRLPPSHHRVPPGYSPMPYSRVQKNWRTWERERYWDRHERKGDHGRGERRGHGRGRGWED